MSNRESTSRTLMVALAVSLVSSVFVAGAAVSLKPVQVENRLLDKQRSILSIAGLGDAEMSSREVKDLFAGRIKARVVDLQTGEYTDAHDAQLFDPLKAARDPKLSDALDGEEDIALIKRRERFTTVYMVEKDGKLESLILPVRGYGLWSTLHGFVALKGDLNTVVGLGFYQHAETPGLGGEVDNPKWKALWPGRKVYDDKGQPALSVIKGRAGDPKTDPYHVDGLSGATITSNGVTNLVKFWFGKDGYGPFLSNFRKSAGKG